MNSPVDHLSDETLNELLDQALDSQTRAAVEGHVSACEGCAARLNSLRSLFARLDSLPDVPLGRDLSASVVNAIRRPALMPGPARASARAPWLAGMIFAGQAAAALLLLAFAWPVVAAFAAQLPIPAPAPGPSVIFDELSGLFDGVRALVSNPLNLWNLLQYWLAAAPTSVAALLPAWLHPLEAALVVAAAAGVWLLGNALILTPPLLARLRRNS